MIAQEIYVEICTDQGKSKRGTAVRAAEKTLQLAKATGELELQPLNRTSSVEKQGSHTRYSREGSCKSP